MNSIEYNKIQKIVLTKLLDKYENSKNYNSKYDMLKIAPIKPIDVFPEYDNPFTSVELINEFEDEIELLVKRTLIFVKKDKYENIKSIYANTNKIDAYYEILGRDKKKDILLEQYQKLSTIQPRNGIVKLFVTEQMDRLKNGKSLMYDCLEVITLSKLCDYILDNKKDMLERELSIILFADTKSFEKKYKSKACAILQKYGNYDDLVGNIGSKSVVEHLILEEHRIFANPTYIYFKGNASIKFSAGKEMLLSSDASIAFSSDTIEKIESIEVKAETIMTIENLTSFNRMQDDNILFIYLGGYHNSIKTRFLKKIAENNANKKWYHFGDIDPDGFHILEQLIIKTGIGFVPYLMDIGMLERYKKYSKKLEKNDITKATNFVEQNKYVLEMQYMLEHNCKLEQEIISCEYYCI